MLIRSSTCVFVAGGDAGDGESSLFHIGYLLADGCVNPLISYFLVVCRSVSTGVTCS